MAEQEEVNPVQVPQEAVNKNGCAVEPIELKLENAGDPEVAVASKSSDVQCALENDTSSVASAERHLSIQSTLQGLEMLVDLNGAGRKACPLCPEEKFKACYSHKLRRHLQNLHWKVYVEFEGQRMCICHLPCRQLKSILSGDQPAGRLGAHYHCVVCSVTIARKTDMVSHLKRHENKGETQASYTGGSEVFYEDPVPTGQAFEIMELGTNVKLLPNHTTPQKTDTYFNRKMKANRQLVFCAVAILTTERSPVECLDAFGATGIMGLQWAKHLCSNVKVTISDISDGCVKMIRENCGLNHVRVEGQPRAQHSGGDGEAEETSMASVEVVKMDANVIMHLRSFDYIHLDPFGSAVNYLDAAFRNVRNLGIVSVTSTDTGSLYSKTLNVTMRHYGCQIVRTEYYRELAARMVIASMARAAARCNKGIEVLLSVAVEHFLLVVVRVLRGPTQADEAVKKIRQLLHCQWCEERVFLKEGSMVEENVYRQLPCNCYGSMPGKTALELGPLWSGPLFNQGFLRRMLLAAVQHNMADVQPLVKTLICESECTMFKTSVLGPSLYANQVESGVVIRTLQKSDEASSGDSMGKRRLSDDSGNMLKKVKIESSLEHPPFYYSIHRHSIRGLNIPKLNKFLQYLTEAGFRVSRTHFDPTGVRTDANLRQFKAVLSKYSIPNYVAPQAGCQDKGAAQTE